VNLIGYDPVDDGALKTNEFGPSAAGPRRLFAGPSSTLDTVCRIGFEIADGSGQMLQGEGETWFPVV